MTTARWHNLTNPKTGLRYVLYVRADGTAHIGPDDGMVLTGQEISWAATEALLRAFVQSTDLPHRKVEEDRP